MKLTKGMKKALSLLLSAAMVVTGVNVTTNTASAADDDNSYVIEVVNSASGATVTINGETNADLADVYPEDDTIRVKFKGDLYADFMGYTTPTIKVTSVTEGSKVAMYDFSWKLSYEDMIDHVAGDSLDFTAAKGQDGDVVLAIPNDANATFTVYDAFVPEVSEAPSAAPGESASAPVTSASAPVTSATAPVASASAPVTSATAPVTSAEPTEAPTPAPVADQDQAFLMFTDGSWGWGNWNTKVSGGFGKDATITGNGDYAVSIDADDFAESKKDEEGFELSAADGTAVFCVDFMNLCNSPNLDVSEMEVSNVKIYADNKTVSVNDSKILMGDIEGKGNFRMDIFNTYGPTVDDPAIDPDALTFKSSLKVTFTLSGIKEGTSEKAFGCDSDGDGNNDTFYNAKDAVDEWSAAGEEDPNPIYTSVLPEGGATTTPAASNTPASSNPSASAGAATTVPTGAAVTKVPTGTAVTTPSAVTGTKKLTVAKSLVVVAPGKSTKVKYTAKKAAAASSAAVVKATSKSKKVATVSVKKAKKQIQIKVPKKAVKGASTTVTVKSTKLNGKAISAKIKVYVRNTAKKVKPAKKTISVKKGKKVKLVLKASGKIQNKKKPVAETITVKGKVLKLASVKYAKKKITLTLKGNKKAKKKAVTIKVGSKKVKVKATVK